MSKEGKFLVYCIERYRFHKKMSGEEAVKLFEKYQVSDYIMNCFGALHTTGEEYIINDIDEYIDYQKERIS